MKNDIKTFQLIVDVDDQDFVNAVAEQVREYQLENLEVEIQYNTSVVRNELYFSALVIARHKK